MVEPASSDLGESRTVTFAEAAGKTVIAIRWNTGPNLLALEVRFTDDTFFWFELVPALELKARYLDPGDGDLEIIRDYGSFSE